MQLSNVLPQNIKSFRMVDSVRTVVQSASRELEGHNDYHRSEFGVEGYIKAFGRFNAIYVDGEIEMLIEDNYELSGTYLPCWCFKSEHGSVVLYADGTIEVGDVIFDVALGNEIVSLLNKLYSVNC